MRKKLIVFAFIIFSLQSGFGQSTNISSLFQSSLRKADIYFRNLEYESAIEFYKRVWERDTTHLGSMIGIAESYRLLQDPESAEEWYRRVFNSMNDPSEIDPVRYYNFAQVLSENKKYDEALTYYKNYSLLSSDDIRIIDKINFIGNMDYYLADSNLYELTVLPFNTDHSEFGVEYYDSGFVFISSRNKSVLNRYNEKSAMSEEETPLDLYYVKLTPSGNFLDPERFHRELKTRFHEGPLVFFSNSQKVIFTRNNYLKGKKQRVPRAY